LALAALAGPSASAQNIAEVASGNEAFSTLVTALSKADLVAAVAGDGPFTVFAPTNDAFAKLDKATLSDLLKPENKPALTQVLTYHVVPGRLTAADLLKAGTVTTLQGQPVTISYAAGSLKANDSIITTIDIPASNGVIHVIDTVLIPARQSAPASVFPAPGPEAARDLIERAVKRGVPLFNDGEIEACIGIYAITARAIISLGADNVPDSVVQNLRTAIDEANAEMNSRERAWILRRALDRASDDLAQGMNGERHSKATPRKRKAQNDEAHTDAARAFNDMEDAFAGMEEEFAKAFEGMDEEFAKAFEGMEEEFARAFEGMDEEFARAFGR
jgi:uncharacterized surface protein with fasciclin (FAS1) repeats